MTMKKFTVNASLDPALNVLIEKFDMGHLFIEDSIRIWLQHIVSSCNGLYVDDIIRQSVVIARGFELHLNFQLQQTFLARGLEPLIFGVGVMAVLDEYTGDLMFTWFVRDDNCRYNQDDQFELFLNPPKH